MQVLLGGLDLRMTHSIHDSLEIGTPSEQPGGVRMTQVVHADREINARRLHRGKPDTRAEGVS